jgi:hypothetical protein
MNNKVMLLFVVLFMLFGVSHVKDVEKPKETRTWTVKDSKSYARDIMLAWTDNQFVCLDKLWTKESNWRPNAYNKIKVMGRNAGGIPQILGMDPKTPATRQIERGFAYILYRYGSPCQALNFHKKNGWY